jgi:predicted ATPase
MFDQIRRDVQCLRERAAALVPLAIEHGFTQWQAAGVALDGWALVEDGRAKKGIARIEQGLEAWRATGAGIFVPYFLALLGWAHARSGQTATGQQFLAAALELGSASGERWFEAEIHRLQGEMNLAGGDRAWSEACFVRALAIAREQGAKIWELRAATSLARLWRDQGRRAEAHDLLAPVYGWFTEGFDTPDLKDAKALLDALA